MLIILGNTLSLLGNICNLLSTRAKTYKNTLLIQCINSFFCVIACICLEGYSGIIVYIIATLRNLCCALLKPTKLLKIILVCSVIIFGIIFMDKTIYGLLPIIASAYYSIVMMTTNDTVKLKTALAINSFLWVIYGLIILDFASVCFKSLIIISCIQIIIKNKKQESF